jgi:hypothetical protein
VSKKDESIESDEVYLLETRDSFKYTYHSKSSRDNKPSENILADIKIEQ